MYRSKWKETRSWIQYIHTVHNLQNRSRTLIVPGYASLWFVIDRPPQVQQCQTRALMYIIWAPKCYNDIVIRCMPSQSNASPHIILPKALYWHQIWTLYKYNTGFHRVLYQHLSNLPLCYKNLLFPIHFKVGHICRVSFIGTRTTTY